MVGYALACVAELVFESLSVPFWPAAVVPTLHCAYVLRASL